MVGFVALFGMAARNTILLISHYDHLVSAESASRGISQTALRGAEERLTPVLLTALLTGSRCCRWRCSCTSPAMRSKAPWRSSSWAGWCPRHSSALLLIPPLAARWLRPG